MTKFRPGPQLNERVAERWAVPEARRLADMLADRVRANAPAAGVWLTAQDERVRPTHRKADGQTVPDNLRFILDKPSHDGQEMARAPRDPDLSEGNVINCFPGWVEAEAVGVLGSIRGWYSGPLVSLQTVSGRVLAGTPNHPVLTHRGWVPLGELKVGDDLVQASRGQLREAGGLRVQPEIEHGPAPLVEVHRALAQAGRAQRVPSGAVDLYGDPLDGEVEVVAADRQLLHDVEVAGSKRLGQLSLPLAHDAHLGARLGFHLLVRGARTAAGLVGRGGPLAALLRRAAGHPLAHRRAAVPDLNTRAGEESADRWPGDAVATGERLFGLAGEVATDELVDVDVCHWSGHVYTLSTDIGIYTVAGGIVVANCRCIGSAIPGLIAEHVAASDVTLRAAAAVATVSVEFPRIVESEHPGPEDDGGGWFARSLSEAAIARARAR